MASSIHARSTRAINKSSWTLVNGKHTKQEIQSDYERVNTKLDFEFELRYSYLLTVLCTCFLYSSGMPVMYLLAALFFFTTYWMDKVAILRFSKKPIVFDDYLAKKTLFWYKVIAVFHVIGFLFMFGYTTILQNDIFQTVDYSLESSQDF